MSISYQPMLTTNAYGGFSTYSDGFVQGVFSDDPATRFELSGGVLNSTETFPMFGGTLIYEYIPGATSSPAVEMGSLVGRAFAQPSTSTPFAFSVFNQAYGMIQSTSSPVPLANPGMSINFFRSGSNARIQVACDPALASLEGGAVYPGATALTWDYYGQQLTAYAGVAWTSQTVSNASWSAGTITFTTGSASSMSGAGNWFYVSGVSPSGYNGIFKSASASGTSITTSVQLVNGVQTAIANPGSFVSAGTLAAGGGAATGIRVLKLQIGNSLTVGYNYATGQAVWNRVGSCAEILI